MSKIAWFSNLSSESNSSLYLERLLPHFKNDHQNIIFSQSSGKFLDVEVRNYLLYENSDFDATFFILEDRLDSSFCYDSSLLIPGIRIFIDNTFTKLKFALLSHISNGVVYDQLLKKVGYEAAIKIGGYHMRGWSLEPYQRLYPIYFENVDHGVNISTKSSFVINENSPKYYVPFPLTSKENYYNDTNINVVIFSDSKLFDRYQMSLEIFDELNQEGKQIKYSIYDNNKDLNFSLALVLRTQEQKSIPRGAILAAERAIPLVFLSNGHGLWGQLSLRAGLGEKERIKICLKKFIENTKLLSAFSNLLKTETEKNDSMLVYTQLIEIFTRNSELLKNQMRQQEMRNSKLQDDLIKSTLSEISLELESDLKTRFGF